MPWLRVDDGFITHRKIAALSDSELRVWIRVLCFSAEHRRQRHGLLKTADLKEISGLNQKRVKRFLTLQLLDRTDDADTFYVHDFERYNPTDNTAAERKRRERAKKNGGNVTVESNRDINSDNPSDLRARARSRTRTPTNRETQQQSVHADNTAAAAAESESWNVLAADLQQLGWSSAQIAAAAKDPERARLAADKAEAEADQNAGGYAWKLFSGGGDISPSEPAAERMTPAKALANATAVLERTGDLEAALDYLAGLTVLTSQERDRVAEQLERGCAA